MADDGTKSLIRSCLISAKEGLTLSGLQNDYSTLVGGVIPYRAGGFSSLEEYLRAMPDVVRFQNTGGSLLLHCVVNASTANIASMVARQKSNKKKPIRRPRGVAPRGGVYGGPGFHAPRFDYRHQRVRNVRPAAAAAPWGAPRFGQQFRAPASARMPLVRAPFRPAAAPPLLPSPQPARSASWSQMPPRRLPPRPSAPCQQPVTVQPPAPVSRPPSAAPPSQVSPPVAAAPPRQPPARPPSAGSSILDEFEAVRLEMRLPEPKVSTVPSKGGTFFAKLTSPAADDSCGGGGDGIGPAVCSLTSMCRSYLRGVECQKRRCERVHACVFHVLGTCRRRTCRQPHVPRAPLSRFLSERVAGLRAIRLCRRYYSSGRDCGKPHCRLLHLCRRHVEGVCDSRCRHSHLLTTVHNQRVLKLIDIEDVSLSFVLELLRSKQKRAKEPAPLHGLICFENADNGQCYIGEGNHSKRSKAATIGKDEDCGDLAALLRRTVHITDDGAEGSQVRVVIDNKPGASSCDADDEFVVLDSISDGEYEDDEAAVDLKCDQMHVCRHWLAGGCNRIASHCLAGHSLRTTHNLSVLRGRGLNPDAVDAEELERHVRTVCLEVQEVCPPEYYRRLRVCPRYNSRRGCDLSCCCDLHLCLGQLTGACLQGSGCGRSHYVRRERSKLEAVGLQSASGEEICHMLAAIYGFDPPRAL